MAKALCITSWLLTGFVIFAGCSKTPEIPSLKEIPQEKLAAARNPPRAVYYERPAIVREPTTSEVAQRALGKIGEPAVIYVTDLLRNQDPNIRRQAAEILARIGPEASRAVPHLTQALSDPDLEVRKASMAALGEIGSAAAPAVPMILRELMRARADVTP